MKVLLIVVVILLIVILSVAWFLAGFTMTGNRQTIDEALSWQSDHYDTGFYDDLEKSDYTVESAEGYLLHVQFLKNPVPQGEYVIISHGYTDNHIGSLKYVPTYLKLGFHCIIYDLRGHGENATTFTTYGILEARDLDALIKNTRTRYKDIAKLGLHGESLGAATTITAMQYKPEIDFAVADCGFSDIENVLRGGYQSAHMPSFLFEIADMGARLRFHYSLKQMRPIDALDENEIPVLFLHGAEDAFILPENSKRMHERTKGVSEIHMIEHAGHAESVLTDPEGYAAYVDSFLRTLGVIE